MTYRKTLSLSIVIAGLFLNLLSCTENKPEYRTETISRGTVVESVTASGTVNPLTTVLVGTQVSGTVKRIHADFNSPVRKGQVIAEIDPATFEAQEAQARANLAKAEAQLLDAERTFSRNRELFAQNLVSRNDLDLSESNFAVNKAQVEQMRAALRMAQTNLHYTRIVSPVDGIVISRNVDVGQTVAASFQTPTLFNIAQDLTKMEIHTSVDEADIGKVRVGQPVKFTVDAFPDSPFDATVFQVRNAPTTVQNVVTYDVVVQVDNREFKLKPGMTANVSIITSTKADVLKVPNAALRFKLQDGSGRPAADATAGQAKGQGKGQGVWVLEADKPVRVRVTPGINDGTFTEVAAGDLKEGQAVIVENLKPVTNNAPRTGPRLF